MVQQRKNFRRRFPAASILYTPRKLLPALAVCLKQPSEPMLNVQVFMRLGPQRGIVAVQKTSIIICMIEVTVILSWDEESSVWIAESQDIPGLILESGSFDALVERVKIAVPDLLGSDRAERTQAKIHFKAERLAVVA